MSLHLQFSTYTLFPIFVLAIAGGVSLHKVKRVGEYKLILLVGLLVFMLSHQLLEARTFALTGTVTRGFSEILETGANVLASVAVYYGLAFVEQTQQIARQLEESESRYRTLTEESPLPILVVRDERIVYANGAAAQLFGADAPADVIDRPVTDVVPAAARDDALETIDTMREERDRTHTVEQRFLDFDGRTHHVLVSGGCAAFDGEPAVHLVLRDVTREREVEETLERTQEQLQTTLESINDAVFVIDPEAEEIVNANSRAAEMLGYDREELLGLSPYVVHPNERVRFREFVESVFEKEGLVTNELSCQRKDGVEIPAEISASVTRVDGRRCVLAAVRDTSERERRRQQVDVLGRVLRHNVRNDMAVVVGHAEYVQMEAATDRIAEAADEIHATANGLVDLCDRVRDLQSVITGGELADRDVAVRPVVEEVVEEFRESAASATIETDLPASATVRGDGDEPLSWALSNLVENAIEHNDAASPWVEVSVEECKQRRGDWVKIAVTDDGPGIPEYERDVATDVTQQTELSHATGIGLWVVGQVAKAFGGEVTFEEPAHGTGTVAALHLPGTVSPASVDEPTDEMSVG